MMPELDDPAAGLKGEQDEGLHPMRPLLLSAARAQLGIDIPHWRTLLRVVGGAERVEDLRPFGFTHLLDHLFAFGFRHPDLPAIGADWRAALEAQFAAHGVAGKAFRAVLRDIGGADKLHLLEGRRFLRLVLHLDEQHGAGFAWLERNWMDRDRAALLHLGVHQLRWDEETYDFALQEEGGGAHATRLLDPAGFRRVLARMMACGFAVPPPNPVIQPAPGRLTQAQMNRIWRLWQDTSGAPGRVDEAGLDAWLKQVLRLDGARALTPAGARRVIDALARLPRPARA